MMDQVASYIPTFVNSAAAKCLQRFKKSRIVHQKIYFFAICLIKLAVFITFMGLAWEKFDEFREKPEYIAVCLYAVSKELELQVNYINCEITVDEVPFTCDNEYGEYGSDFTNRTSDQYNEIPQIPDEWGEDISGSETDATENDPNSSSSSYANIPSSGPNRRVLKSPRSLESSENTPDYPYSVEADEVREFGNDIQEDYLVFLFILYILFNFGFRVHNNLYTYRRRIIKSIPRYSKSKKLKIVMYENVVDISVATAWYPFTYPEYGDCLECSPSYLCDKGMYTFVNIGFYLILINVLLTMFDKTSNKYIDLLRDFMEYVKCNSDIETTGTCKCFLNFVRYFLIVGVILFAIAAFIVVLVDIRSSVYLSIQIFISIIFYFTLFLDGDEGEGKGKGKGKGEGEGIREGEGQIAHAVQPPSTLSSDDH